ncbi:hypothetical protein [Actinomyces provencensis]|uniref:hypothetical protein n=1 Tax=Actinomyces provencensis TaxID=1720198 RepID=UPI001177A92A|nr:hypothetical protein [Actinomyces provencensis]
MSAVMVLEDIDLELEALRESMPSPEVEESPEEAKKPKRPITAAAPVPLLLRALATAQWGYLDGYQWQGVRSTLRSIGDLVHYRYGQGTVTAWDVKRGTGLTERWVRECLYWLEDAGLIEWRRGGVYRGVPQAGWMRINKKALVDLIRLARPAKDQATRDRNARTRARLARLGTPTIKKQRERSRRSVHAELSADPTHKESGGSPAGVPSATTDTTTTETGDTMYRRRGQDPDPKYLPVRCYHGVGNPMGCHRCRWEARKAQESAEAPTITYPKSHRTPPPEPQPDALSVSAFDQYMDEHYPDLDGPARARAALADPKAKELARG